MFGERVDSSVVTSLKRDFTGAVVISAGTRIISSTLPLAEARIASIDPGQTGQALTLGDEEYLAAVVPLGTTQSGAPVKITLLQPLTTTVRAADQRAAVGLHLLGRSRCARRRGAGCCLDLAAATAPVHRLHANRR